MRDVFEITSRFSASGLRVYTVTGRFDALGAPRFVRELTPPLSGGECVVVNLSGVRFLASSGIGALLALSGQARESGGELRLAEPSAVVAATIDLLGLREYLDLHDTEEEALKRAA